MEWRDGLLTPSEIGTLKTFSGRPELDEKRDGLCYPKGRGLQRAVDQRPSWIPRISLIRRSCFRLVRNATPLFDRSVATRPLWFSGLRGRTDCGVSEIDGNYDADANHVGDV